MCGPHTDRVELELCDLRGGRGNGGSRQCDAIEITVSGGN